MWVSTGPGWIKFTRIRSLPISWAKDFAMPVTANFDAL